MARIYQGPDACRLHVGGGIYAEFAPGDAWTGDPGASLPGDWVEAPTPTTPAAKRAEKD